jgi:methionyl-tRNA synthetase
MVKTNGPGIHPFALIDHFGADAYRYFFLREVSFGNDGSFSWEAMTDRYTADLANGLGNLASRVLAMLGSYFEGAVPAPGDGSAAADVPTVIGDAARRYDAHMDGLELSQALAAVWSVVDRANGYLVETEPWKLAKVPEARGQLEGVLYTVTETLRVLAVMIAPVMPAAAARLWEQLGLPGAVEDQRVPDALAWGGLPPGTATVKGSSLFPRLPDED